MNTDTIDTLREDRDAILCQARNARVRGDDVEANELSGYAYRLTDRILDAEAKRQVAEYNALADEPFTECDAIRALNARRQTQAEMVFTIS